MAAATAAARSQKQCRELFDPVLATTTTTAGTDSSEASATGRGSSTLSRFGEC
jgi:hypothetical protein